MLIVIGSDGNMLGSQVANRFGQANYYIVYDTKGRPAETVENKHNEGHDHESEEEHDNLQGFIDKGVEAFIVGNVGPHAFRIIKTPETKVYLARKMTVAEAIGKFIDNELVELTEPTAKRSISDKKALKSGVR